MTSHALGTRISEGGLEDVGGQLPDELVPDEAEATASALLIRAPTSSEKPSTGPENAFIGRGR